KMPVRIAALMAFTLALAAGLLAGGRGADALSGGVCATAAVRYFTVVCHNSNTAWSGLYAKWLSVPLNIAQSTANAGRFVAQAIWLNDHWSSDANFSFLEIGDTAGGGAIPGHVNEWARMTYWVRGTASSQF